MQENDVKISTINIEVKEKSIKANSKAQKNIPAKKRYNNEQAEIKK